LRGCEEWLLCLEFNRCGVAAPSLKASVIWSTIYLRVTKHEWGYFPAESRVALIY
jgi:hypothetical protein